MLAQGGVFAPLRDQQRFNTVEVGPAGRTILWRGGGEDVGLVAHAVGGGGAPARGGGGGGRGGARGRAGRGGGGPAGGRGAGAAHRDRWRRGDPVRWRDRIGTFRGRRRRG